ncbi:MAG TPA: SRPBCC family protein [Burkholderiaceae bacterium]|nr:SRPBCC family protein [Burkholderiaceae bacterium]
MPNTVRLHRVLAAPPERVYRAFTEPAAMASWLPPHGFTCAVQQFEPQVGGRFRMSFTQFATGHTHGFGGEFLELVPAQRLRYTDVFDDPNLPGTLEVTVELNAVSCGTELHITQAGIPDAIPPEMCYLGWQDSLDKLRRLVEPDGSPA